MWIYEQKTGRVIRDGNVLVTGYSGKGEGKNNPDMQSVHNVGPIPQGLWSIGQNVFSSDTHGPYVVRLYAHDDTFGRSGFLIHGDSRTAPGEASEGCIILPRLARMTIHMSGDRDLTVVRGE